FAFMNYRKATCRAIGGEHEFMSELSLGYMTAIRAFLARKPKHRTKKLSTFVFKQLNWSVITMWERRFALIKTTPADQLGSEILRAKSRLARRVIFFHGKEWKCNDSALLVHEDHAGRIDRESL